MNDRTQRHDNIQHLIAKHKRRTLKLHKTGSRAVATTLKPVPVNDHSDDEDNVTNPDKTNSNKSASPKRIRRRSTLVETATIASPTQKNRWKQAKNMITKNIFEKKAMAICINASKVLANVLTAELITQLINGAESQEFENEAWLYKNGDEGNGMYIVQDGQVELLREKDDQTAKRSDPNYNLDDIQNYISLTKLSRGSLFGESSLLVGATRQTAARCIVSGEGDDARARVIFISRALYLQLKSNSKGSNLSKDLMNNQKHILKNGIMDRVECFKELTTHQKELLIEVMRPIKHKKGEYICKQGERGTTLHVITHGQVKVTVNDASAKNGEKTVVNLTSNQYFGEIALLNDDCERTANCIADTNDDDATTTTTMVLHKSSFDAILGSNTEVLRNIRDNAEAARLGLLQASPSPSPRNHLHKKKSEDDNQDELENSNGGFNIVEEGLEKKQIMANVQYEQSAYNFFDSRVFGKLNLPMVKRKISNLISHIYFGDLELPKTAQDNMLTNNIHANKIKNNNAGNGSSASSATSSASSSPRIATTLTLSEIKKARNELGLILRNILHQDKLNKRTEKEICFLMQVLKSTKLFKKHCKNWNVSQIRELVQNGLKYKVAKRSKPLFQLGKPAKEVYFVMKGALILTKRNKKSNSTSSDQQIINVNEIAGELALQGVGSRVHTCIARVHSHLIVINVKIFLNIAQRSPNFKIRYSFLRKNPIMKDWTSDKCFLLAFNWKERTYEKGEIITEYGEIPSGLKIVMKGNVGVYAPDNSNTTEINPSISKSKRRPHCKLVSMLSPGEIFDTIGILATSTKLIKKSPKVAQSSVQVVSESKNLQILELPVSNYYFILECPYPTIERIYTLENQRSILYANSLNGWKSSMSVLDQQKLNNNDLLENNRESIKKIAIIKTNRNRTPSMESVLLGIEMVSASETLEMKRSRLSLSPKAGERLNLGSRVGFSKITKMNSTNKSNNKRRSPVLKNQGIMLRTIKSPSSPPLQSSQKEQKRTNLYSNSDSQLPMKEEADMNSSSSKRHIHGSTPPQSTWWKEQNLFQQQKKQQYHQHHQHMQHQQQQQSMFQHRATSFAKPFTQRTLSRSDLVKAQQALRDKKPNW